MGIRRLALAVAFAAPMLWAPAARACFFDMECVDPRSLGTRPIASLEDARNRAASYQLIAASCETQSEFSVLDYVKRARGFGDLMHRLLGWPRAEADAWRMRGWGIKARDASHRIEREYGFSLQDGRASALE